MPTTPTRYCGLLDIVHATLSSDGAWALFQTGTSTSGRGLVAVRTADPRAGRWTPTAIGGDGVCAAAVPGLRDELYRGVR